MKGLRLINNEYNLSISEIEQKLETQRSNGLTNKHVDERTKRLGPNEVVTKSQSKLKIYLAPLFDTLITIYLIMTAVLIVLSIWVPKIINQVAFWFFIISFNMAIAIFQQFRAQKKLDALKKLAPLKTQVIRDGKPMEVLATKLVVGDLIELGLGDRIPADLRIISSSDLTINEASLTGESKAVTKAKDGEAGLPLDTPLAERKNMLYLGTFVQTGSTKAIVTQIGNNTELGQIASQISEMQTMDIPLRRRINLLGKRLGSIMLFFLIVSMIYKIYERSKHNYSIEIFARDLSSSITTAMSVIPINIPLLTTIILITGVLNMAKKKVIVKELSVVETLGRTSVLCSDKTGTMTTSKMTVTRVWDTENYYGVSFNSEGNANVYPIDEHNRYDINGTNGLVIDELDIVARNSSLELILSSITLNNDATIVIEDNYGQAGLTSWEVFGNATDGALLVLGYRSKLDINYITNRYELLKSYPFNSSIKRMSKLFRDHEEGDLMLFSKGAAEVMIPKCSYYGNEGTKNVKPLEESTKESILNDIRQFANLGYRVVTIAYRAFYEEPQAKSPEEEREWMENELVLIGFVCLLDPPRPNVKIAVKKLDSAGIFPIMITGDSPDTARTIATQVGVLDPDEIVIQGKDISKLSDEDFFKVSVFARVSPQDKLVIVDKYQQRGDIVAMTGDGVNDSLAITRADAGIAMGITGTEVAKEAADIILADDSYVSLVDGVEQGRALFEKIRMIIFFFIAINIAEGLVYIISSFIPDLFLLNNIQRAYIFSIVHGIPPMILIVDTIADDTMKLKPRQHDNILSRNLTVTMTIYALSFSLILGLSYYLTYTGVLPVNAENLSGFLPTLYSGHNNPLLPVSYEQAKARTILITIIYLSESFMIFSIRRINQDIITSMKQSGLLIWFLVLFAPAMHVILMYSVFFQNTLGILGLNIALIALSLVDWIFVILAAVSPILILELMKLIYRKFGSQI